MIKNIIKKTETCKLKTMTDNLSNNMTKIIKEDGFWVGLARSRELPFLGGKKLVQLFLEGNLTDSIKMKKCSPLTQIFHF